MESGRQNKRDWPAEQNDNHNKKQYTMLLKWQVPAITTVEHSADKQ